MLNAKDYWQLIERRDDIFVYRPPNDEYWYPVAANNYHSALFAVPDGSTIGVISTGCWSATEPCIRLLEWTNWRRVEDQKRQVVYFLDLEEDLDYEAFDAYREEFKKKLREQLDAHL